MTTTIISNRFTPHFIEVNCNQTSCMDHVEWIEILVKISAYPTISSNLLKDTMFNHNFDHEPKLLMR